MVLLVGIKVRTGRRECRPLALGHLMKVCGMQARRQVLDVELNGHARAALALAQSGGADALSFCIFQFQR